MKAFLWSLCLHIVLLGLLTYHHFAPTDAAKVKPEPPILAYAYQPIKARPTSAVIVPVADPAQVTKPKPAAKAQGKIAAKPAFKQSPVKPIPQKSKHPTKVKPAADKLKTAVVQPQRKPFVPVRKPAMVKPLPITAKPLPKPAPKQPEVVAAKPLPKPVLKQPEVVAAKPVPKPVLKQPEVVAAKPLPKPALKQPEVVAAKPLPKLAPKQPEVVAAKPLPKPVLTQPEVVAAKPLPKPVLTQPEVVATKPLPQPVLETSPKAMASANVEVTAMNLQVTSKLTQQEVKPGPPDVVAASLEHSKTMANKTLQAARQGDASGSVSWKEKQKQLALDITATKVEQKPEMGRKVKTFADGSSLIDTNPGCWKVPPAESRKGSIWLSTSIPCKADTTVEQIDAILQKRRSYSRD